MAGSTRSRGPEERSAEEEDPTTEQLYAVNHLLKFGLGQRKGLERRQRRWPVPVLSADFGITRFKLGNVGRRVNVACAETFG